MSTTILIADDDPVVRHILGAVLEGAGYCVVAVETGGACLEALRTGELPGVLFLDIQLPDTTGSEVLRRIRLEPRTAALPVIVVSANPRAEVEGEGFSNYLEKPFTPDTVHALLSSLGIHP